MSNDNQHSDGDLRDRLLAQLEAASSVNALRGLLGEIEQSRDAIGFKSAAELARMALSAISSLTAETPGVAAGVIVEHLLPWCLTTGEPGDGSSGVAFELHQLRGLLKEWVYQYPQAPMLEVRSRILEDVQERLKSHPTRELLWVASAIGFRTSGITDLLWPLAERKDEIGDVAIGVLALLGTEPRERDRLLDAACALLSSSKLSRGLLIAVQELVGPYRIELAVALLKSAEEMYRDEDRFDFSIAVSTATHAVDRCSDDQIVHDEMWTVLRNHRETLRTTSDYGYRCDTKATLRDHVNWLLADEFAADQDIGAYIMLTRLSELTKPQQLAAWDEVVSDKLTGFLERLAKQDTEMKGLYTTTRFRLKTEAWETALTAGCSGLADWIDVAVMDETSASAVHAIAGIIACLRLPRLPARMLDAIVSAGPADDDNGILFREVGMIEIARSSCCREAFESLMHFGLTHNRNVLLSTIDAITDVAISRLQEGDDDVIEKLLEMTMAGNQKRHREAMISTFCRLCARGFVQGERLVHLWTFANADDLDNHSRREALEAIGLTDFEEAHAWKDLIRQIGPGDEGEFGWRACEVLVRRDWLTSEDEQWLFTRLGLAEVDSRLRVQKAAGIDGWQAFLIGLLFRKDKDRFCDAVRDVLTHAPLGSVSQILDSLRHHGDSCSDGVAAALAGRIRVSNDRASTDTELFNVLAAIAPSRLLTLGQVAGWTDWLVEARTALCEAIGTVATARDDYRVEAVACLVRFMRDASFQVRRSAYRAIAQSDFRVLASVCLAWSQSGDMELRKRAAEATAWLPVSSYPDEAILEFGFGWDPEPSVREIWKGVLSERRGRRWAADYLDRILTSAVEDDQALLKSYRYGRALAKIGDDESVKRIDDFLASRELKPNVRHWLKKVAREIERHWRKVTERWPEPWSFEQGGIELLDGEIVLGDGTRLKARLSLWCRYRSGPSDFLAWGGVAYEFEREPSPQGDEFRIEIQISGRPSASANVSESRRSSRSGTTLVLRGSSPYPAEPHYKRTDGGGGLVDAVAKIIRETGVNLTSEEAEEASIRLQPLLERADVSLFRTHPEYDTGVRRKIACQEAALVIRTLAESLPRTFQSSMALWRIANSILEKESLALRVSPAELDRLGELARLSERESDELLFWMVDRVEGERSDDAKRRAAVTP